MGSATLAGTGVLTFVNFPLLFLFPTDFLSQTVPEEVEGDGALVEERRGPEDVELVDTTSMSSPLSSLPPWSE